MFIHELIAHLQLLPHDLIVVVQGYESGYQEVTPSNLTLTNVTEPLLEVEEWEGDREQLPNGTPALLITRSRNS